MSEAPIFGWPERHARDVSLVRAVEVGDRSGVLLAHEDRRAATEAARSSPGGDDAAWIGARAERLAGRLRDAHPALQRLDRWLAPSRGVVIPMALVALVLGVASNALGAGRAIHVLAVPLLGAVIWNLVVLLLIVARRWLPLPPATRPSLQSGLEALARRSTRRMLDTGGGSEAPKDGAPDRRSRLASAVADHVAEWGRVGAGLEAARLRRALHLAAAALVGGMVLGMYLRGLAFEYRATWDSTFLGAGVVQALLDAVLGPAAWVLRQTVPAVAPLRTVPGDAAPWIHLWAGTAAMFVVVPRLALVVWESLIVGRRRRRVDLSLPPGYLRRLRSAADPTRRSVSIIPYSHEPTARAVERLRAAALDAFGARAEVRLSSPVAYGEAPPDDEGEAPLVRIVLLPLAQTPETEVHGEALAAWRSIAEGGGPALIALVDGAPYRKRLGAGSDDPRVRSRERAWDRVVSEVGLTPVHVDLEQVGEGLADRWLAGAFPTDAFAALDASRARP